MSDEKQYLATMRLAFFETDDVAANVTAELIRERASELIEEEDTIEVTQVIPLTLSALVEPSEMVNEMRRVCDMLIATRVKECYDLAQWMHKTAWILEHRIEPGFSDGNYDYMSFVDRANTVLQSTKPKGTDANHA